MGVWVEDFREQTIDKDIKMEKIFQHINFGTISYIRKL